MTPSRPSWAQVSLSERLAALERATGPTPPLSSGELARREAWLRLAAGGDPRRLRQRLAWDGHSPEAVDAAVSDTPPTGWAPPDAAWAPLAAQVLAVASDPGAGGSGGRLARPDEPAPFEEVLLPLVALGERLLAGRAREDAGVGAGLARLTESAVTELVRRLLADLAEVSAATLLAEFEGARPAGHRLLFSLAPGAAPPPSRAAYEAFVARLRAGGLADLLRRRPALLRALALRIHAWEEAAAEFLARLAGDWEALVAAFDRGAPTPAARVGALACGLSDRHHDGRTVTALRLDSGTALVYKPRSLALEDRLGGFIAWCNATGSLAHPLRAAGVLDRGSHGWMEWIDHDPLADDAAAGRYYHRAGALLGIVHLLWGTDCHRENLIASGEHPVLVDGEALLHHTPSADMFGIETTPASALDRRLRDSVLRTGMLPRWDLNGDPGLALDVSAFGGPLGPEMERVGRWRMANTDWMHRREVAERLERPPHRPWTAERELAPDDHVDSIVAGFSELYRLAAARRAEILAPLGPLEGFRGLTARFVLRPTRVYLMLQQASLEAPHLADEVDRSLAFEPLRRVLLDADGRPPAWALVSREIEALGRFDVPFFHGRTDATALEGEGIRIEGFFRRPSFDHVVERVQDLSEADLGLQVGLIRGAFHARAARTSGSVAAAALELDELEPAPDDVLLAAALAVARDLAARALDGGDGSVNWVGVSREASSERYQLQPLAADLYAGVTGVALFLSAAERAFPGRGFGPLALSAVAPLRDHLLSGAPSALARWVRDLGLGGYTGLGSVVWGLARIGALLGEAPLLDAAGRAARLVTPEAAAADRMLDVLGGSAGAILGLLALHRETGDPGALEGARACAERLLAARVPSVHGPRAWRSVEPEPLTGMSHGAAGIAMALGRLHASAPDPRWLDAAREALDFERAALRAALDRAPGPGAEPSSVHDWFRLNWCRGAAGVGLARLGSPHMDGPDAMHDLEEALRAVRSPLPNEVDHLCCGNAGRSELLADAGRALGDPALEVEARRRATWMLERARAGGGYCIFPALPYRVFSPGLLQGEAGIGYHLLRLVDPTLPSVLLLD